MFFQCTSEYTPIAGANGIDGVDGVDGVDGSNADAALCITCHSSSHRDPIIDAYVTSGHGSGGSWARGTSADCAQCHNNEGYIDYLSGNFYAKDETTGDYLKDINGDLIPTANPDGYAVSNPINCTGCHTAHRSFDFTNDGNDYAVRNIDPVKLDLDPTITIDLANGSDALGLSNACITCHQPRTSYPIPTGTDPVTITSSRYGPHHGPQSTVFEGIMGANIVGSTGYPGAGVNGDSGHRAGTSCVACHMGESTVATEGGHTWMPSLDACVTCHDTMTEIPEATSSFATNFPILHDLLVAKGYISESGSVLGASGANASSTNPLVVPVKEAQAIWNYKTLEEDKSNGMHNPKYTDALLKNSIEALQ
tara:strand:+ start:269 stop:1366 length:1098 start_codon:yes stop_codon:yes gene_type:complete